MSKKNGAAFGILAGLRGIIRRTSPEVAEMVEGFLPQKAFEQALAKERSRTDRGGSPFVMLLITVCAPKDSERYQDTAYHLSSFLMERTRVIDSKGWFGERLGVLMPQTTADQAQIVWSNIEEAFQKRQRSSSGLAGLSLAALKSEIYTYPSDGKHHGLSEAARFANP